MNLYGHRIARQMEEWWRDHGGRYDHVEWRLFIETYGRLFGMKCDELLEGHSNDGRFGMSKAGGCTRAAQLKLLGADSSELSGSSRATFFIGHTVEVIALATLIAMGYEVSDMQAPIEIAPFMKSARDATIIYDGKRTLLSIKSMSYKKSGKEWRGKEKQWVRRGWPELPFMGVRASQPGYWAQMQAEMNAGLYEQGIFLAVAKDMIKAMEGDPYLGPEGNGSLTFYAEMVRYDAPFANGPLVDTWREAWVNVSAGRAGRGLQIHKSENRYVELDPNGGKKNGEVTGAGWNHCDYCDFREACLDETLVTQLESSLAGARS